MLTGFDEKQVLNSKLTIFMPKELDEAHEQIIKQYLNKKNLNGNVREIHTWLKHKNQIISPIIIKVHPNVSLTKGLALISVLISPPT